MIEFSIKKAFETAKRKEWKTIYMAVDIHDTIVYGNYEIGDIPKEFISISKVVLQYLSLRKDVVLILNTCSHPSEIVKYLQYFKDNGIEFKYANENPEVPNDALGCYTTKFYYNISIDDKSGFDAEKDWYNLMNEFTNYKEL